MRPWYSLATMTTTSVTLIQRLSQPQPDHDAWARFVDLYSPLLDFWARKNGLNGDEAADLVQDVLIELMEKLPRFEYDAEKSFRGWMRRIIHRFAILRAAGCFRPTVFCRQNPTKSCRSR